MPKKNTDKLLLKGDVPVRVAARKAAGTCARQGICSWRPGADGVFTETLPPTLAAGAPRPLTYFVELKNHNGRSAGLSNDAVVLAGEAPGPVAGLAAQVRKDGVALRWTPDQASHSSQRPAPRSACTANCSRRRRQAPARPARAAP